MPVSYTDVVKGVKNELSSADRGKTKKIETAIEMALDEFSMRLKSIALLKKQSISISADDREKTLTGDNDDLKYLLYVKYGTGDEQDPIEYVARELFLEKYDNPSAEAGTPSYYTILESDEQGFPILKFDVPADSSETMIIYYFPENTPQSVVAFRSKSPITTLALAYFHGRTSENGGRYYALAEELMKLARSSDAFGAKTKPKFVSSKHTRAVMTDIQVLRDRRY